MKNFFCVLCLLIAMLCATLAFFPMINNAISEHNSAVGPDTESSELPGDDPSELPGDDPSELPGDDPSELPGDDPSELPGDDPSDDTPEVSGYTVTLKVYRCLSDCGCPLALSYTNSLGETINKSISEIVSAESDCTPQEFLAGNNEFTTIIIDDVCGELTVDFSSCGLIRLYEEDYSLSFDGSEYHFGSSSLVVYSDVVYFVQGIHC